MSSDQLKQLKNLKKLWRLASSHVFKPSGSRHDMLALLLMVIVNNTKTAVEYGAHTGQMSALIASLVNEVDGKFIGVDDWNSAFFDQGIEKSQGIIKSNLEFLDVKNYELITANCDSPVYVDADFHYWDICFSYTDTADKFVSTLHSIINKYKDGKNFMICIDDVVKKHSLGNHPFIENWQLRFKDLPPMYIPLITDNKLFLTNYKINDTLVNQVMEVLNLYKIFPYTSYDKFYDHKKYMGNFFEIGEWDVQLNKNNLFWNDLEKLFNN
jgi:hypothetical protein